MVRLSELHEAEADHLRARAAAMPRLQPGEWVTPKPLSEATVAIISTAGLHRRDDPPFTLGALDYRILPGDVDFADVSMSHISANFDRSAYGQDPNIVFPLDRLREMPDPSNFEATGTEVGRLLAADGVDVALLIPV
jgi:D-proline reductase (dithiol) PrdB